MLRTITRCVMGALFLALVGCVSVAPTDRVSWTSICEKGGCTQVSVSDAPVVLAKLKTLFQDGLTKPTKICEASRDSQSCTDTDIGIFVMGGPIPGRGAMKELNFNSVSDSEVDHALVINVDTDLTFLGVPLMCSTGQGTIKVDPQGRIILEVDPHYCNWALVGSVFSTFSLVVDRVDIDKRVVSGYWSTAVAGVGNGKGSGYGMFSVPDTRLSSTTVSEINGLISAKAKDIDFKVSSSGSKSLAGRKTALVIGNSAYAEIPLSNTIRDAKAMSASLESLGFKVIKVYDANFESMRAAIKDLYANAQSSDVIVLYYAGHGVEINGRNYLIATDVDFSSADSVLAKSVDVNKVLSNLGMASAKPKVIILDACRDNPFPEKYKRQSHGLAQMDAPIETFIAFSTSPGKVAEDGAAGNSPYTKSLSQKLVVSNNATIEKLFKDVRKDVVTDTRGRQTPWENTSLTSDIRFSSKN